MQFSFKHLLLYSSCLVDAFPTFTPNTLENLTPERLQGALNAVKSYQHERRLAVDSDQPIDVTGRHAFQAPRSYDQRGPCPGLNALANHGYVSHDGITSFAEVVTAINQGQS